MLGHSPLQVRDYHSRIRSNSESSFRYRRYTLFWFNLVECLRKIILARNKHQIPRSMKLPRFEPHTPRIQSRQSWIVCSSF